MSEQKTTRSKILQVRITIKEWDAINEKFSHSTCRKLSDYIRSKVFDKPITIYSRNQSLDDCMHELIRLKNELNAIGINYNQVVKKMYTLDHIYEVKNWLLQHDQATGLLAVKMNDIKLQIGKINDAWLQS
ncbi:plasmid mobilization protein [Pinibacter aurantiacus]|uniref:Plasmid mobilization relaxosome protein MobC n=1 Tax=Pinibacter aurantiacus TaxID=2851599 RepID=A0A9E2S9W6_9BACT|nr:plasmid mobilization relaxosome protein MobC [Pinibacter aurantiacus]MBV4357354.1 plasmid mobilization relaxosome protein MobC [Pinibacter aurantiacus]